MLKCEKGHRLKAIYYNLYIDKIRHSYHTIKNKHYCMTCDKIYLITIKEIVVI